MRDKGEPADIEALKQSEARYRGMFEQARDMMHIVGIDGCIIDVNQAELDALGYSREEMLGKPLAGFLSPELIDEDRKRIARLNRGESFDCVLTRFRHSDGHFIPVELTAIPQIDNGKVISCMAISRDISARLAAEQKLEVLSSFPQYNPAPLMRVDAGGCVLYANPAALAIFGERFTGSDVRRVPGLHDLDVEACIHSGLRQVLYGEVGEHSLQWVAQGMAELGLLHIYGSDVSWRRRIEQRYAHLVEMMPDAVAVHQDGRIVYNNTACAVMFGYENSEAMQGVEIMQHVHPDYRDLVLQRVRDAASGIETLPSVEEKMLRRDGSEFWVEVSAGSVVHDGRPASQVVVRDISQRKQAEAAVVEQYRRNELILQSSMDGFVLTDVNARIIDVNPAYCDITGYGREELLGMHVTQIGASMSPEQVKEKATEVLSEGVAHFQTRQHRKDGTLMDLDISIFLMQEEEGREPLFSVFVRDVSEIKHAAARLRRILDADFDAVIVHQDLRVVFSNRAAQEMFGFDSIEQTLGVNPQDFMDPAFRSLAARIMRKVVRTGKPTGRIELGAVHPEDGHIFPMEIVNAPVEWGGRPAVVSVFRDISARKQAERELRASEEKYRSLFDDAQVLIHITDADGMLVDVNSAELARLGYAYEELIGRPAIDLVAPECRDSCIAAVGRVLGGKPFSEYQTVFQTRQGEPVHVEISATPQFGADGRVTGARAIMRDITEKKRLEEERDAHAERMQSQQAALVTLAQHASRIGDADDMGIPFFCEVAGSTLGVERCGIWLLSRDGQELRCLDLFEQTGRSHSSGIVLRASDYPAYFRALDEGRAVAATDARTDMRTREFAGHYLIPLDIHAMLDAPVRVDGRLVGVVCAEHVSSPRHWTDDEIGFIGGVADQVAHTLLSWQRRKAEADIRGSEEKYRSLFDDAHDLIHITDAEGIITDVNRAELERLGYSREEMLGRPVFDFIPPDLSGECRRCFAGLAGGCLANGCDMCLESKSGERVCVEVSASPQQDAQGKVIAVRAILHDVTQRQAAEKQLQESEQRLQAIVSASPVPTVVTRFSDGKVLFSNIECRKMFAVADEEHALQMFAPDIYADPGDRSRMISEVRTTGTFKGEIEMQRTDGTRFWALMSSRSMQFGEEQGIISLLIDVTSQRLLEEQFRQAQKMESVGTLVGGIAHDFNNMLAGMLGQLYLIRHELIEGEMAAVSAGMVERINAVEKQGRMAADVIAQLMTFARKGRLVMERLDVNRLVADAIRLHRVSIPENIAVRAHFGDALDVRGDAGLIQQMLLNLLTNARDAVQGELSPQIEISLSTFEPDASFLKGHLEFSDMPYACLAVRDNGCGMSEEQMKRIFDPFFTTKPVGKGTGLGLAMLYGAMQTHHGHVLVESEPGKGSCFRLCFPKLEDESKAEGLIQEELVQGGGQTILLADDESLLIEVIGQSLQMIGYRVLTAQDGEQAVRLFAAHRRDIALVILDVVMPVMGGVDAAREIRAIAPDVPVVFHTGYGDEADLDEASGWHACATARKPVNIELLSRIIAGLLAGD